MASILEDNGEETLLQVRLNGVATIIGIVGFAVTVAVLIILVVRFFTGHIRDPDGMAGYNSKLGGLKLFTNLDKTLGDHCSCYCTRRSTLACFMRKMMADKALVRRLSACETMGSAATICSDKTGTLTLNQTTVVEAYACGIKIDPPDNKSLLPPGVISLLIEGIAQNTTGSIFLPEGVGAMEISGSPTEKAILQWGVNLGMDFGTASSDSMIIHAFPFNLEKKRSGVALKLVITGERLNLWIYLKKAKLKNPSDNKI